MKQFIIVLAIILGSMVLTLTANHYGGEWESVVRLIHYITVIVLAAVWQKTSYKAERYKKYHDRLY